MQVAAFGGNKQQEVGAVSEGTRGGAEFCRPEISDRSEGCYMGTIYDRQSAYSQKLRDPRWQKRRLEILQRDNFTCRICDDKEKTLHVHHRRYIPGHEPWDYIDELLVTLCEDCHSDETEQWKNVISDLEGILIHLGYFSMDVDMLTHELLRGSIAIPRIGAE
jgi:hypothetical protein